MITPFVALLAVYAPPTEGQWVSTSVTPQALAAKADDRLAGLRNAKLTYHFTYYKEAVGAATAECEGKIAAPNVFWLQLPNIDTRRKNVIEFETWIADGKRFGRGVADRHPRPGPLASRPGVPARPASVWFTDFSRVILSGLGQPTHPFASLVTDGARTGFRASTSFRQLTVSGRKYLSYRLVLTKGRTRYETVIDGRQFLPVSVTNTIGDVDNSRWTGRLWSFPRKPIDPSVGRFTPAAKA